MSLGDRLLSRKFWLAVSACIYFGAVAAHEQIAQVVIAYLAVQAGVDAFGQYQEARAAVGSAEGAGPAAVAPKEEDGQWTEHAF